ncbi:hypothetical protein LTR94_033788, partial [Friedmanniomyces endolithicus]
MQETLPARKILVTDPAEDFHRAIEVGAGFRLADGISGARQSEQALSLALGVVADSLDARVSAAGEIETGLFAPFRSSELMRHARQRLGGRRPDGVRDPILQGDGPLVRRKAIATEHGRPLHRDLAQDAPTVPMIE